jgi:hypothetical protein
MIGYSLKTALKTAANALQSHPDPRILLSVK